MLHIIFNHVKIFSATQILEHGTLFEQHKISRCTFCFVCSFVGLMCLPSAEFGPYVYASWGWLVEWFAYWSGSVPFLYGGEARFKYGPYADASGGWLVDRLVYWSQLQIWPIHTVSWQIFHAFIILSRHMLGQYISSIHVMFIGPCIILIVG